MGVVWLLRALVYVALRTWTESMTPGTGVLPSRRRFTASPGVIPTPHNAPPYEAVRGVPRKDKQSPQRGVNAFVGDANQWKPVLVGAFLLVHHHTGHPPARPSVSGTQPPPPRLPKEACRSSHVTNGYACRARDIAGRY